MLKSILKFLYSSGLFGVFRELYLGFGWWWRT